MLETNKPQEDLRSEVKILLVDDDQAIRSLCSKALEKQGFRSVRSLPDGRDALSLFENDPEAADIVVMDQRMPIMNGTVAARKIKVINPKVKIIMVSSYDDWTNEDQVLFEIALRKPLTVKDLCESIDQVILLSGSRQAIALSD
jgi:two-component system, response regulator YesN